MTFQPFKRQGRDIYEINDLVAQTTLKSSTIDSGAHAVGLAGRIVALLNATHRMSLDEALRRLAVGETKP